MTSLYKFYKAVKSMLQSRKTKQQTTSCLWCELSCGKGMKHSESLDLALANEGFPIVCIVSVHRLSTVNGVCTDINSSAL